jgi:hypothetical protein
MAKIPDIFSRIRSRVYDIDGVERTIKFATPKFGADLSNLVRAPKSLLERLGMRGGYVEVGKRPTVRSVIVTAPALSKARLEAEEGRPLNPAEVRRIRGGRRHLAGYLKQKLRFDPRLGDPSQYHPDFWNTTKTFEENWTSDQKRFLRLAWERTGIRFELTESGEWVETPVPGASRKLMSAADWDFYTGHYFSNVELYGPIGSKLLELPPGEVSPRVHGRPRRPLRPGRGDRPRTEREAIRLINRHNRRFAGRAR